MIKIKNVSTSLVSLYVPTIRLNRELIPGRAIPVSQEEYEDIQRYQNETGRQVLYPIVSVEVRD